MLKKPLLYTGILLSGSILLCFLILAADHRLDEHNNRQTADASTGGQTSLSHLSDDTQTTKFSQTLEDADFKVWDSNGDVRSSLILENQMKEVEQDACTWRGISVGSSFDDFISAYEDVEHRVLVIGSDLEMQYKFVSDDGRSILVNVQNETVSHIYLRNKYYAQVMEPYLLKKDPRLTDATYYNLQLYLYTDTSLIPVDDLNQVILSMAREAISIVNTNHIYGITISVIINDMDGNLLRFATLDTIRYSLEIVYYEDGAALYTEQYKTNALLTAIS